MVLVDRPIVHLTDADVADVVARAMRTGEPLDRLVATSLYGSTGGAPEKWGDWTPEARALWDLASRMWDDVQRAHRDAEEAPDVNAVWSAIAELASLDAWPLVPYLTWSDMATVLHARPRFVTYHCSTIQGWRFQGRYGSRLTVRAPCLRCGKVDVAANIRDRIGLCCAGAA